VTKEEVVKLLTMIEKVYQIVVVKDETISKWLKYCDFMEAEKVNLKFHKHIRNSPYPPQLRQLAEFSIFGVEVPSQLKIFMDDQVPPMGNFSWMDEYAIRKIPSK
jgi:hypothetical protein